MVNRDKSILIIGAGNIGRGVIGGLFYKAGYKLVFYDISISRMKQLNEQGHYLIKRVWPDKKERIVVDKLKVVDSSNEKELIDAISKVNLVACCVYQGAFESICRNIAEAIKIKMNVNSDYLNILLCVNSLGAPDYFNEQIEANLSGNKEALSYFYQRVGICQALVGMAAMPSTPELLAEDSFAVTTRMGGSVGIDKETFRGNNLEVEGIEMVSRAKEKIYRKVYTGNMKHCMTAFMGKAKNYKYIEECDNDKFIQKCVAGAFNEAEEAVQREFNFDENERQSWRQSILGIKNSNIKDEIARVSANPITKLNRENRFVGPALLCIKHNILPFYLSKGIAYGFLYRDEKDKESIEITDYVEKNGIEKAIRKYCGLRDEEWMLIDLIKKQYEEIKFSILQ